MELTPKSVKIDIKMVVWLAIVVFVLCLVCVLLRVKLETLLDNYVSKQVSQQAVLFAELSNEKLRMRLDALVMQSRKIEADGLNLENIKAFSDIQDDDTRYGMISLDGTIYTADSVYKMRDEDFRCAMESFRGKPSVCYSEEMNYWLGVPVFNRHNVRYVLFRQYTKMPVNNFFDVDCFDKKCFIQVTDAQGNILVKNNTGVWSEDSVWKNMDFPKIYGQLQKKMNRGLSTSLKVDVAGEPYYFYMAKLLQGDFFLAGMFDGKEVAGEIGRLTFLVFWVVCLLMFLFLTGLGIRFRFKIVRKPRDLDGKDPLLRVSEQKNLLETLGQEIHEPVMNILNKGAILMRENPEMANNAYISEVQDFGRELELLSNDIFDINKIESNSLEINTKEYDLFTLLSLSYSAGNGLNKGMHFELQVESSIPSRLEGDDVRLGQILSNILFNADKLIANDVNVVHVGYEWIQSEEDNDFDQRIMLVVSVPDSGASWTSTSLTLVRMMVVALGGSIQKNVTKEGLAVVRIELPQKVIKNEPVGDFRARYEEFIHASEKKAEHFVAPNASILAIDEVPMNLRVMSGLVKESCAQFESVSNGMEAIECFRNHHYDIVFLDNTMPIIDGLDILTIMKTLRNHPNENTPIIMLTAEDNASAKNICESLGYTDFLTKPVHEQALSSILLKYLPQEKMTWYDEPVKKDAEKRRNTAAARASEPARENASESAALDTPAIEQVLPEDLRALSMTGAVNVAVGLYCCERNEALYRKRLMNYMDEHYEATLAQFFKEEDFENYRLSVQSLKSASLYIGAINIASIAKILEYACNEGNYDLVHIRHNELMNGYRQLIKILKEQQRNGRAN